MDNHGELHTRIQNKKFAEQTTSELDARLAEAAAVRQMIDLLEGFDGTSEHRARILEWTRAGWSGRGEGTPFPANAITANVFDLIRSIEDRDHDGEYIVRRTDVAGYISWLRQGIPRYSETLLAVLALSSSELSVLIGIPGLRYWEDGLGWFQSLEFASPMRGRRYLLTGPLKGPGKVPAFTDVRSEDGDPADLIAELFECLAVDSADTAYLKVQIPPRWKLLRRDDNGHACEISRFSCRSKALKKLSEFEKRAHKQTYWLEPCDDEICTVDQDQTPC